MSWFTKKCVHRWAEYVRTEIPPASERRSGACIWLHNNELRLAFLAGQVSIIFRCELCTETRVVTVAGKLSSTPVQEGVPAS